ncbi:recombinase family protein [Alkalihalophilus marmarensis]|uniref:recombinase family protein n=1 Tax=Alkalihalophilus marmarensis TaxID=521377 RepID=UPI002E1C8A03|nr:recombinase family protein [Alkalihalophilus marmarensis]MED1601746.1 recombinase family protein [Alkalihalophilus marmarensis]
MPSDKKVELIWNPPEKLVSDKEEDKKSIIRVAAYCRASTAADTMIKSLENQIHHYLRVIQNNEEFRLVGIYYDSGTSGLRKERRPGFQRLIRHCRERKIDVVLTKSVSRFSRNAQDLLETVDELSEFGVAIHFERENINTLNLKNKFFLTALAAIAQEESRTISELTTWGFEKRFQRGIPLLKPQYGYYVQETKQGPIVTVNEEEAAVVREIFDLYIAGLKKSEIARRMIERGIKTAKGKEFWNDRTVDSILTNHNYTGDKLTNTFIKDFMKGTYSKNDGSKQQYLIENTHPAIITRKAYEQVQELINQTQAKNKLGPKSKKQNRTIMTSRISCGRCNVNYHSSHKTKQRVWLCSRRNLHSTLCTSKVINEHDLLLLARKAFEQRYDFRKDHVVKEMISDIKNQKDHFEYRRILYFLELERTKEEELAGVENVTRTRTEVEEDILTFEEWASKVEEDRTFREQAIQGLEFVNDLHLFFGKMTLPYMRAWVMGITIFSSDSYIIRWFDNTETTIGDCKVPDKPKEVIPSLKKQHPQTKQREEEPIVEQGIEAKVQVINPHFSDRVSQKIKKEFERFSPKFASRGESEERRIRTAAYARISTDIPHQLGSLEAQIAYFTYHILKDPTQSLVKVYAEKGVSGTNTDHRKEFQRLIEDCKNGKIERVITKSISRFGRNTVDVLETVRALKALSPPVEIIFQKENIRTLDEDSEVMLTIYSGLAQEESRSLSESVAWGKRRLAERGAFNPKHRRYGYEYDEEGNWLIIEKEEEVVRRMYKELLAGISTNQIAKALSEEEIVTVSGNKHWSSRTIDCIITNPVYCGDFVGQRFLNMDPFKKKTVENTGQMPKYVVEDHHPAIVSREEWEAAQQIMQNRGGNRGRKLKPHTRQEFFDVFHCSECGSPVIHIRSSGDGSHYWRCKASGKPSKILSCKVRGFREESIEHTFMSILQEMKNDEELYARLKETLKNLQPTETEKFQIEEVKAKMQQLYHELYDTVEEGEKLGGDPNQIKRITDQIVAHQNQIYEFEDQEQKSNQLLKELDWFLNELEEVQDFNPEKQRIEFRSDIFSRIVKRGTIFPDGRIVYDLIFGIQWDVVGANKMVWKLKKKGKPRKRKKN